MARAGLTTARTAAHAEFLTGRESPAFALFLAALAVLPLRWLSPLGFASEHAGWTDLFAAAAIVLWLADAARRWRAGLRPRVRPWQYALAAYVLLGFASAAFSADVRDATSNALISAELAFLAVLAADFASDRRRRAAIAFVVMSGALVTAALAAVALALFYLGLRTSLLGPYGDLAEAGLYARVRAGFHSPPLLASYCIFASAVIAMRGNGFAARWRRATQVALAATVVATVSRAIIGFAAAAGLRVVAAQPRIAVRRLAAGAIILVAIAAMAALTLSPSTLAGSAAREGFGYRDQAARSSWQTLVDHPMLGIGPGELPGIIQFPGSEVDEPVRAHLTPLNIAATAGLPALLALVLVIALIWRDRTRPTDIAIWVGLLGLAIDGLGQDIDHFRHVWILLGLAAAGTAAGDGCLSKKNGFQASHH